MHLMGLFAAFIEARCVSHVKNERICERNLFVARRVARREAGKLCEEGITAHKARQLLGIALHMARPFTHTHTGKGEGGRWSKGAWCLVRGVLDMRTAVIVFMAFYACPKSVQPELLAKVQKTIALFVCCLFCVFLGD